MSAGRNSRDDRTGSRIVRGVIGVVAIALAVLLALRPLTTLQVTVWAIAAAAVVWGVWLARAAGRRGWVWALAVVFAAGGVALVLFTPQIVRSYPVLLCLALALNGVRLAAGAARPSGSPSTRPSRAAAATDRVTAVLFAAVNAIAAALVWVWPDVGLLLLAWAVAAALAIAGLVVLTRAVRGRRPAARHRPRLRRAGRVVGAVLATTVAIAATVGSVWVNAQVASVDDFYRIAAAASDAPGELLRVGAYEGETPAGSTSLRILYSTLRADGSPAVASAVVAIPTAPAPSTGRTMLAW